MKTLSRIPERIGDGWRALPRIVRWVATAAFVAVLAILPMVQVPLLDTPDTDFPSLLFDKIGLYVLMGIGLNVVVGKAGLLDLGYVAFFAIGAYTMAEIGTRLGWSVWVILPTAMIVTMVAGVILGLPTLRLRGDYLAIVTLGFGEIVRITALNTDWLGASRGVNNIPWPSPIGPLSFDDILDPKPFYWVLLAVIVVVIYLLKRLDRSRVGRAWEAMREDEIACRSLGINTTNTKLTAFAMGAMFGGFAGAFFATRQGFISPESFVLVESIMVVSMVVLGGMGNIWGVIAGALLLAGLNHLAVGIEDAADICADLNQVL